MRTARVLFYPLDECNMWPYADSYPLGLPPPGDRDAHLLRPHRPSAVHMAPQALHLHLGEPNNSKVTIWHEGTRSAASRQGIFLTFLDHVHLHPDPVH
jgi:hypothetical protein